MEHPDPTILARSLTHLVKLGDPKFACCGRTPFTVSLHDRVTADPKQVTCGAQAKG